ncbi:hypothetical protein Efla_004023 [Eimeria flavescens]
MGHRHRTALKQQNKAFKGSSSKPKSLKEKRKKAAAAAAAFAVNRTPTKADRLQQSKQRRLRQRRELQQNQAAATNAPPPKVVVLLPFSDSVCIDKVFSALKKELQQNGPVADGGSLRATGMEEDGQHVGARGLEAQCPSYTRHLFKLPDYAQKPGIAKKHPQQVLLLPAPSVGSTKNADELMQQEEGQQQLPQSELLFYMDLCSSCDVLVCVFGGKCTYENSAFNASGYQVLQALKLQGLPPAVIGVGCTDSAVLACGHSPEGKSAAADSLKFMHRYFDSELGAERKFFRIEGFADWRPVVRALGAAATLAQVNLEAKSFPKGAEAAACRRRGHMLALSWRITCLPPSDDDHQAPLEPCLEVVGLVRGAGLTCRLPVHVTGVGDFVASRIEAIEPLRRVKRQEPSASEAQAAADCEILGEELQGVVEAAQPLEQLDMTALEQTWPTGEEVMGEDVTLSATRSKRVRVPKNVGDYERAWLESDTDGSEGDNGDGDRMSCDAELHAEDDDFAGEKDSSYLNANDEPDDNWKPLNATDEQQMEADNEAYVAQRREAAQMEREFPDQMDTPLEIPAKDRFQKYRGLKSFRSSPWVKNEDLPLVYGRIIDVSSIKGLAIYARRAHAQLCQETGGFSGRFCRLCLPLRHSHMLQQLVKQQPPLEGKALDEALAQAMARKLARRFSVANEEQQQAAPAKFASADDNLMLPDFLIVSQLLQHESQVAVVHSQVTFCDQEAIKGKDPVLMLCGFRRFPASPIYSEEPRQGWRSAAKWKFRRWAEPGTTLTATVYAPLILPPSPCIFLRSEGSAQGGVRVSAWGSVLPVNGASSRLIIKRVLLSGHPFKVHKRKAVVRFMFFNPDDVRWFAPIELRTRRGLRGNIVEPLGTHGYMKCKFSDYVKQNDEVLLPLYRRVFPKWYPVSWGGRPDQQPID